MGKLLGNSTAYIGRVNVNKRRGAFGYNYLMWLLVRKNIKNKYRRSFLGVLWTVLLPLMEMLVMAMIFGRVNGAVDSRIFIMCGVVIFGFNREATLASLGAIIGARGLIDRVYIPHLIFPLSVTFSALANMLFSIIALLCLAIITQVPLSYHVVFVVLNIPALVLFCGGISIALSAINVYFRDIGQLYVIALQLWIFVSGVYIQIEALPEFAQSVVRLNPMYYFVTNFRTLVMDHQMPSFNNYLICYAMGILSIIIGMLIFKVLKKNFILYI
ncbi:MAG: ABC transporter permease [Clostridiales bacterium]|jgi:ABC-type polysaccharide/polyol phosphate export permease|nr:ABC transporter permease [Clostridiales bacterium]